MQPHKRFGMTLSRRRLPLPPCNTAAIPPVYLLASYCTAATYFDVDGILTEGVSLIIDTRHRLVGLLAFASALLPRHGNSKEELSSTEPPEPGVAPVLSLKGQAMKIIAEREHYLLVSDGTRFTVVERRAGKFYPLCNGNRHGVDLDDEGVAELMRWSAPIPKAKLADA